MSVPACAGMTVMMADFINADELFQHKLRLPSFNYRQYAPY